MPRFSVIVAATLSLLDSVHAGPVYVRRSAVQTHFNYTISGAPGWAINAVPPANRPNAIPSDELFQNFRTAKIGQRFREDKTLFIYLGRSDKPENNKRQDCFTDSYQAVQVPDGQSGTWWGSWEPATGCYYQGDSSGSSGNCQSISASVTTSWSASVGFSSDLAGDVLDFINADGGLNFGFTWGYSTSTSEMTSCCPGSDSVSQIWSQSQYGWSNSQVQTCYYNSCFPSDQSCGAWSAYQHADWALPDGMRTVQYGCSTGSNNVRC